MDILGWFRRDKKTIEPFMTKAPEKISEVVQPTTNTIQDREYFYISLDETDPLFISAGQFALTKDSFKVTDLQRKFKLGYPRANNLFDDLEKAGVISKHFGAVNAGSSYNFYGVPCMNQSEWAQYLHGCVSYTEKQRTKALSSPPREMPKESSLIDFDSMSGEEFEVFCAKLLAKNGYSNINLTKNTGDRGVDITASKDGVQYVFQCKWYASGVGNAAVQEVFSGKSIYNADVAVVITNSYFTEQAKSDAERLRVRLWDREKILLMKELAKIT